MDARLRYPPFGPLLTVPQLRSVQIIGWEAPFVDEDVCKMAHAWRHLERLTLPYNARRTDDACPTALALAHLDLARGCPELTKLELPISLDAPLPLLQDASPHGRLWRIRFSVRRFSSPEAIPATRDLARYLDNIFPNLDSGACSVFSDQDVFPDVLEELLCVQEERRGITASL